jgi:DNA-binding transcriptional LysR family regulator
MDRLIAISTFAKVVDAGSFSAAASRLAVSPAVVSTRVQELERQLGVRLLNRTTRKVALTEVGRKYYDSCVRILSEVEEAEQCARSLNSMTTGKMRINMSLLLEHDIPRVMCDFLRAHPGLLIETTASARMIDLIGEGFDLALRTGPIPDSSLMTRALGVSQLVLCASPGYLDRSGIPHAVEDLAAHTCLAYVRPRTDCEWMFERHHVVHKVQISDSFSSNSTAGLRAAALSGLGIALLPNCSVVGDLQAGRLVQLLPDFEPVCPTIYAVYPPGRHLAARVRSLIDFLAHRLRRRDARGLQPAAG